MKNLILLFGLLFLGLQLSAQEKAPASPPATATATVAGKTVTINYGSPSVKGRKIWGGLVPYDEVWRAGANTTTSFTVSSDVTLNGQALKAGKYAFFVLPTEKEWTIIINKTIAWGAYSYKKGDDVIRFSVPVKKAKAFTEKLTYEISDKGEVCLSWENDMACFNVK